MMARYRISSFFAPPTVWISLLRSPLFDSTDLSGLRKGYYGASIMPVEVLRELLQRLPNVRNLYGQTEIAPLAAILGPQDQLRKAGSCGRAALNVETRIVDESMREGAPGVVGEIVHRSPHLMLGYLKDDERSEALYRLPQVSEVAVIGIPHPHWVEAVVAVVVIKQGLLLTEIEVQRHCAATMAAFKSPKRVVFVDALPKNHSGKLLKRELRGAYSTLFTAGLAI
jgi:fatty-acyl-CoA synthase